MVLGVGVDLVDVVRFARIAERHGEDFAERILTPAELSACAAARRPYEHQAVRFAAREAVLKALGTGLAEGMAWRDIEVRPGTAPGVFSLSLAGGVGAAASALGVRRIHLAVSTTRGLAAAAVILEA
jgi:holo-[acyl-carrier protein] synthase